MSDNTQSQPQMERKEEEAKNGSEQEKTSGEEEEIGNLYDCCLSFWLKTDTKKENNFLFLDIDLNDPEVEAAAAKIQSAFKFRMKGKKN